MEKLSFVLLQAISQEFDRESALDLFKGLLKKDVDMDCKLLSDKERQFIVNYINLFQAPK